MKVKTSHYGISPLTALLSLCFAALLTISTAAFASSNAFVEVQSNRSFDETVSMLKQAVSSNGLMVMGQINQARVLSMTGLNLKGAQSFLVGNPKVGKKLFSMSPAAGAVLPARIYVWVAQGKSHIGYFKPSTQLASVDPRLEKAGEMLDGKFRQIIEDASR